MSVSLFALPRLPEHVARRIDRLRAMTFRGSAFSDELDSLEQDLVTTYAGVRPTVSRPATPASIDTIKRVVATIFETSPADLMIRSRRPRHYLPRAVAIALARELTDLSCGAIAAAFGRADHTAATYATERVNALCFQDPEFRDRVDLVRQACANAAAHDRDGRVASVVRTVERQGVGA